MALEILLHTDGSFDIASENKVLLKDCFPSIDQRPLRVSSVRQEDNALFYETPNGTIQLKAENAGKELSLTTAFHGFSRKIHHFSLFGEALCPSFEGFYQSAGEIGNPCGYQSREAVSQKGMVQGIGLAALTYPEGSLLLWCKDHRKYENQYAIRCWEGTDGLFSAGYCLEKLNQPEEQLPALFLQWYPSLQEGLEKTASSIGEAMHARTHQPPAFHWCSWYYYYSEFDQKQLSENLEAFQTEDPEKRLRYIQIDAAYSSAIGDWLSPRSYWPKGIEGAVKEIQAAGYTPGIWIGPFMVGNRSQLAAEHPDWLLKDEKGEILCQWVFDNEPKLWGYQDEEYYVLDTSHPEAMQYLRMVFRTFRQMGIRLFKTDFMLWGLKDSSTVTRHTPGKTGAEYFREVLQMIREEIGEESYWLGCIAPFFPFIGYADAMRIGDDVGSSWDGRFNPHNMIASVKGNLHTNYAYYQTDPDSIFLRNFHIRLDEREIRSLALYAALSGGCVYTSDPIQKLPQSRKDLLWFIQPDRKRKARDPYLTKPCDDQVLLQDSEDGTRSLLLVFNSSETEHFGEFRLPDLGKTGPVYVTDFDGTLQNCFCEDRILLRTPPHGCHLLLLSSEPVQQLYKDNMWKNL